MVGVAIRLIPKNASDHEPNDPRDLGLDEVKAGHASRAPAIGRLKHNQSIAEGNLIALGDLIAKDDPVRVAFIDVKHLIEVNVRKERLRGFSHPASKNPISEFPD